MERRNYPRFETNESAMVIQDTGSPEKTVILEEVAEQGVRVIGYEPLKPKDHIKIHFKVPFFCPHTVQKKAVVIWVRPASGIMWEAGLDFGPDNLVNIPFQ
ncbi:MAG: PilZ domain-containing protein [Candidatus Omnitrophica bacterium]|jgi:hypothetical protein|nr:PilZ domain-containing protein [Candidatus Omnitrophota bacterium]MDD5079156.1 PilZ domain-containing protein [Candidatus Omnitrophota bacterium]